MKHTPGPWTNVFFDEGEGSDIYAGDNELLASAYPMERTEGDELANARLIAAAPDMFVALAKLLCPGCDHELQHHVDKYGCEIERGDGYRHAEFEEALGPCGCNEDDLRDDYPDYVRALAAFKKARGE